MQNSNNKKSHFNIAGFGESGTFTYLYLYGLAVMADEQSECCFSEVECHLYEIQYSKILLIGFSSVVLQFAKLVKFIQKTSKFI